MEFSEDFLSIQTSLNYCNEYIKAFHKIEYVGG